VETVEEFYTSYSPITTDVKSTKRKRDSTCSFCWQCM